MTHEFDDEHHAPHRCGRRSRAHQRAVAHLPPDADANRHQLHRSGVHFGRDASHLEGIQHRPRDAGIHPQLLLHHLRFNADSGRHASRSVQAARRHRRGDFRLGLLPGCRRGLAHRLDPRSDAARSWRVRGADLPGGRQTQRHLDDVQRTCARRDAARRRRPAWRGARFAHHRGLDRRIRFLADFLRRCGRRHNALRSLRLVVHPQQSRRASVRQ